MVLVYFGLITFLRKNFTVSKATKQKFGRPTKYKPEYAEQAMKLAKLGAIDEEIADFFKIDRSTLVRWKRKHKDFCATLKRGKVFADTRVVESLYRRACGYSHPEVHVAVYRGSVIKTELIKHYPPDTTSCIFWLKNRKPDEWRDKQENETKIKGDTKNPLPPLIIKFEK